MNSYVIPATIIGLFAIAETKLTDIKIGEIRFTVEVADSPIKQIRGLMNRANLSDDEGMLFVYTEDRQVQFWMKNVPFSLDMIFLDRCGIVTQIHRNAKPHNTSIIRSSGKIRAVLEIRGGASKRAQISIGDTVFVEQPVLDRC